MNNTLEILRKVLHLKPNGDVDQYFQGIIKDVKSMAGHLDDKDFMGKAITDVNTLLDYIFQSRWK